MKIFTQVPSFKLSEKIGSIFIFLVAFSTYTATIEPTASYWDSGEFISVAYKLQIPHAPGAPFYSLVGRMFSLLANDNPEQIAFWVNMVSVVSSSFTILFLFWSLVLIIKKFKNGDDQIESSKNTLLILGSSAIGALSFAFSDSFWFSAVEAEVYALSSLFTAIVFWAILKWETVSDTSQRNKILILIAFLMGLSVGVHPLNLLTIPCLALVMYFKRNKISTQGIILTLVGSGFLILLLMFVLRINLLNLATALEIYAVNDLGLPFNSGASIFLVLIVAGIGYVIWFSQKNQKVVLNTAILCFTFILIGYSSYVVVSIRSAHHPPLNYSNPQNLINLSSYLNMEDFGSRPLLKGPYYYSEVVDLKKGNPAYIRGEEQYEIKKYYIENEYDAAQTTLFPRLYSDRSNHPEAYAEWLNLSKGELPSFKENLKFFFSYQLGHMYLRYFMWNFSGRESDVQNAGWVALWDSFKNLPDTIASNKARNNFLMLPLLLGFFGILYSFKKHRNQFIVVLTLFLITGAGLIIYLNPPPLEPRERDYIYVGSFFAFCIWIGIGALALADTFSKWRILKQWDHALALTVCLSVPVVMAAEGWNDHDRSDRYYSVDSAKNFLATCPPNAILFTGGDNDTYPLWYAQEVEGYRTDVRVIVTTLYNTDWFISQLMRQNYQSAPLPLQLSEAHYQQGGLNDYIPVVENPNVKDQAINLKKYLKLIEKSHPAIQVATSVYGTINSSPSSNLFLPVDTSNPQLLSAIPGGKDIKLIENLFIPIKNKTLYKGDLLMLDFLANNNWERPVYFSPGALQNANIDLQKYLVNEGYAYRLLPVENVDDDAPLVNTEVMYTNMMKKYQFRELDNKDVYYNDYYKNQLMQPRASFNELARAFIDQEKFEVAKEVLEQNIKIIPDDTIPYDITTLNTVALFFKVGEKAKAKEIADVMVERMDENLTYYLASGDTINEARQDLGMLNYLGQVMAQAGEARKAEDYHLIFERHFLRYEELMRDI